MSEKCCGSNSKELATQNNTNSCCSSSSKQGDTLVKIKDDTCCSSQVNADERVDEKTTCCSSDPNTELSTIQSNCCSNKLENHDLDLRRSTNKTEYRIQGMDCPSCALTIEKGLSGINGIEEVKVHYSTAKLQLIGKENIPLDRVESEVQKLGYSIEPLNQNTNIKSYSIEGMDCGACAKSIENHLNTIPTVKNVSVNFSTGKMQIEHENSVEAIINEVSKIGFKASPLSNNRRSVETTKGKNENGTIIVSGILIALGFIGSYTGINDIMSNFLYAIAMLLSGYKPVRSAYYSIKSRSLDMNVLMSVAAIGAALIGEWLEGATVVWLFALGNFLQNRSIEQTRNSIRNLIDLAPPEAWIKVDSQLVRKPVEDIDIGEVFVVKPGDKIPLDGEIINGESSVNQAPITGESIPVDKAVGDKVFAGTINENGSLEIKVTKLVEDTTIAKIIHLVEEAQEQKAPTQAFVDKFASIYTPIVFILALLVMVLPPLLNIGTWGEWFYKGLELLVVACPCALVISTPVAIVSAIGNAAKNGVLIKGGTFLEAAGSLNAIAFDKTGTLTEGKPKVSEVLALNISENELLSIACTLEDYSTHPIARSIVEFSKDKGIPMKSGELYKSIVGKGVQATIENTVHYAGNLKLFEEINSPLSRVKDNVIDFQNKGKTVVIIGTKKEILGIIAVSDTIRQTTVSAIKGIKQVGISQVVMLTGDNKGTAEMIASEAGVDRYFAELLPEDKVSSVKKLQSEGYKVAMVGDGINDAPALATANLGIAMGGAGTDTAMETADIVLMADNLEKLPHTIKLSKKALRIIKQNIWFSLIVKFVALAFIFPGWLTLWIAVLSDTGAALIVILNAIRLLKIKD
ncbi:heavy metal translocating P-type ATPase [Metabacillus halosaccharovorans]|uniref:heavy metal translocating P-type ATPase n=1 Tax=Metabacillus halosaccharovorans TaxID=930124 RepID=UPI00203AD943|nr:heavy metal translocating P-type ATPase [Metabacillus halosaccharovorans]MCM3441354.1 cadmium-translocating P-type ATPase [Metabacillus halosaccharovorans]